MPEARSKKTFKALAGALIAAALVVAPLVTAGASAAAGPVGEFGTIEPMSPKANDVGYWNERYDEFDAECYKHGNEENPHGSVTDDGKTVTLNEFQQDWHGDQWVVLVVKGATSNNVIENPVAGVAYASPLTKPGGPQSTVSHWIVCKGTVPTEQPEVVTPTLTWSLPTCKDEATFSRSSNATWKSSLNEDGTTTWTATPLAGQTFAIDAQTTFVVPDLTELPEGCSLPEPTTVYGEWTDGTLVCGQTTVVQTRTVTITTYTPGAEGAEPTATTTTNTEQRTRPATQAEIGTCPLVPGDIEAVCVGDVPYLGYGLTLPEGFVADSETPVTITFLNPDGENYVVTDQPLNGKLLWPGASDGQPKMWPGWTLVNGEYAQTDGNFAWTRQGVTVRFDVNPTYSTEVEYPEASAECANPPIGAGEDPTPTVTPTPTATPAVAASGDLAVTGGGVSPVLVAAGGATLAAGIAVVAIAAYRRRRSAAE